MGDIDAATQTCRCGSCTKCVGTYRNEALSDNALEQNQILKTCYNPQRCSEVDAKYEPVAQWKTEKKESEEDRGEEKMVWADKMSEYIESLNGGVLLEGQGGHGKTTVLTALYKRFVKAGKRCAVLAPTNAAAINILNAMITDGVEIEEKDSWAVGTTLHKFMGVDPENIEVSNSRWNNIGKFDYIFIDEYTMVPDTMWHLVYDLYKKHNVRFIVAGDYHQLPDIMDAGSVRNDYEKRNTAALREICDFNTFELTVNKRSSDDMKEMSLAAYEGNCPHDDIPFAHEYEVNLCWLNSTRKFVNELCMERIVKEIGPGVDRVFAIVPRSLIGKDGRLIVDDRTQLLRLTLGAPVICYRYNKKLDVNNNERFYVTGFNDTSIRITSIVFENKTLNVPLTYFQKHFLVNYCMTTHKAQGISIDEPYAIWDMGEMLRNKRTLHCGKRKMLYTALTRTTDIAFVHQAHFGCHLPKQKKPFQLNNLVEIVKMLQGYDAKLTVEEMLRLWEVWGGRCCHCGKRCSPSRNEGPPLRVWTLDRKKEGYVRLSCYKCSKKVLV